MDGLGPACAWIRDCSLNLSMCPDQEIKPTIFWCPDQPTEPRWLGSVRRSFHMPRCCTFNWEESMTSHHLQPPRLFPQHLLANEDAISPQICSCLFLPAGLGQVCSLHCGLSSLPPRRQGPRILEIPNLAGSSYLTCPLRLRAAL